MSQKKNLVILFKEIIVIYPEIRNKQMFWTKCRVFNVR